MYALACTRRNVHLLLSSIRRHISTCAQPQLFDAVLQQLSEECDASGEVVSLLRDIVAGAASEPQIVVVWAIGILHRDRWRLFANGTPCCQCFARALLRPVSMAAYLSLCTVTYTHRSPCRGQTGLRSTVSTGRCALPPRGCRELCGACMSCDCVGVSGWACLCWEGRMRILA